MLQQTTVAATIPYYESFLRRFPDIAALAAAPVEAVLAAWAGLGYYARARNLHACARAVVAAGGFPRDLAGLRALPGIGVYTAAAIGGDRVRRCRRCRWTATSSAWWRGCSRSTRHCRRPSRRCARWPRSSAAIRRRVARPSDFAQALFDLGATVCTPAAPACVLCPWMAHCAGRRPGIAAQLPRRAAKRARPLRHGVHFWLTDADGNVLLRRRPPHGLLGGMTELPGTDWRADAMACGGGAGHAPMHAAWRPAGQVRHGFTHFELTIDLFAARVARIEARRLPAPDRGAGG